MHVINVDELLDRHPVEQLHRRASEERPYVGMMCAAAHPREAEVWMVRGERPHRRGDDHRRFHECELADVEDPAKALRGHVRRGRSEERIGRGLRDYSDASGIDRKLFNEKSRVIAATDNVAVGVSRDQA